MSRLGQSAKVTEDLKHKIVQENERCLRIEGRRGKVVYRSGMESSPEYSPRDGCGVLVCMYRVGLLVLQDSPPTFHFQSNHSSFSFLVLNSGARLCTIDPCSPMKRWQHGSHRTSRCRYHRTEESNHQRVHSLIISTEVLLIFTLIPSNSLSD